MTTRLEIAFQRLEAAVESLEKRPLVEPDSNHMERTPATVGSDKQNVEINAIRQLVDQALMLLADEKHLASDSKGGDHD